MLANELVPGDIVTFGVGDRIPADVRLVTAVELEVDESSLTGETVPSRKGIEKCMVENGAPGESVALAERTCVAYMGTLVRNGESNYTIYLRIYSFYRRKGLWSRCWYWLSNRVWCYILHDARCKSISSSGVDPRFNQYNNRLKRNGLPCS